MSEATPLRQLGPEAQRRVENQVLALLRDAREKLGTARPESQTAERTLSAEAWHAAQAGIADAACLLATGGWFGPLGDEKTEQPAPKDGAP